MVATREALSVEPAPARSLTEGDVGAWSSPGAIPGCDRPTCESLYERERADATEAHAEELRWAALHW